MTMKKCEEEECNEDAKIRQPRSGKFYCLEHGVREEPLERGDVPEPAELREEGWDDE